MNYYVLVEGIGDKKIYDKWIPLANKKLSRVDTIQDINCNNYYIVSGGGYPNYLEVIDDSIETVNTFNGFNKLVISVDSEESTQQDKYTELTNHLAGKYCRVPIQLIIQHFCIETWLLGNNRIGPRNPKSEILKEYKMHFDVLENDPELLPPYQEYNRAQFAFIYLKKLLNEKGKNVTYIKGNPQFVFHSKYFLEVKKRYDEDNHIVSFEQFLSAFN